LVEHFRQKSLILFGKEFRVFVFIRNEIELHFEIPST
jgi:hypothetical protein